ncbi:MAG: pyridoxal phosphate-dependent aminotransferase [Acidobacteriota bacterium]
MMFSSRLGWDSRPNRLAAALQARRRAGRAILDLTESNPTRAGFAYPGAEVLAALSDPRSLRYDPAPAGSIEAREAVAAYYAGRGQAVEPERILLTASTSEAYAYLFKVLADPGDQVLVPRPSYPLFDFLAALESVKLIPYPLVYDGRWSLDLEALARASTDRSRAVILVNPNNPTGSFLKKRELEGLVAFCRERSLAIISDEVFSDYAFGPDAERVTTLAGVEGVLAFCLSGLSKIAGLPQMKLGWIVTAGPAAARAQAMERLELVADTYLSVGTPVQCALPRLLAAGAAVRDQIARRVRENLDALRRALTSAPACQLLEPEGGWYAILRVPRTRSEEEWCLELVEHEDVLVQPGYFYDFESEAYLVASLLTARAAFDEGVRRLVSRAKL